MARGVNKVILLGNVGQNLGLKHTGSGIPVVSIRIATDESYKDRDGNKVPKTEWHNVVAWDKLAEICADYLKVGDRVYIEGSLQTRSWEDRDGNKRYTTEIKMRDMMMLGGSDQGSEGTGSSYGEYTEAPRKPAQKGARPAPQPPQQHAHGFFPDDELPF